MNIFIHTFHAPDGTNETIYFQVNKPSHLPVKLNIFWDLTNIYNHPKRPNTTQTTSTNDKDNFSTCTNLVVRFNVHHQGRYHAHCFLPTDVTLQGKQEASLNHAHSNNVTCCLATMCVNFKMDARFVSLVCHECFFTFGFAT